MKKLKQKKHISGGKFIIKRIIRWTGIAVAAAIILSTGTVTVYRFINPVVTPLMVSRWRDGTVMKTERKWTDYEQISQNMVDAVVASEDNLFAEHSGFDFKEMRIAYEQYQNGRTLRGASTITQQTCKNVFLWDGRSYVRKGLEAWFTVLVEMLWSKRRIMEVYLNVIETGTGIYGIEAAAQIYYKKPASRLSREESAMIAAILPSPAKRNPVKPSAYLIKRQHQILDLMDKTGTVKL